MTTVWLMVLATCLACDVPQPVPISTARLVWHVEGTGWAVTPWVDQNLVYFGSIDHQIVAIDRATGVTRWRQSTGMRGEYTEGYNIVGAGSVVAIGDVDVFAFDRATGDPSWTFRAVDDEVGRSTLASDGKVIYAPSMRNRVYAIDSRSGAVKWMTQLPGTPPASSIGPIVHDGMVFVGSKRFGNPAAGAFVALDARTGTVRWAHEFVPAVAGALHGSRGQATVYRNLVIVAAEDGVVYAFDRRTGRIEWTSPHVHTFPPGPGGTYSDHRALAVAGRTVVVGSTTGIIIGLDARTGVELWRWTDPAFSTLVGEVTAANGFALVRGARGDVIAFDAATGAVRWSTRADVRGDGDSPTGPILSPARAQGGVVYLSGEKGYFALNKPR